jgi:hypothetical protein
MRYGNYKKLLGLFSRPTAANIRNEYNESVSLEICSLMCLSAYGREIYTVEMKYLDTRWLTCCLQCKVTSAPFCVLTLKILFTNKCTLY